MKEHFVEHKVSYLVSLLVPMIPVSVGLLSQTVYVEHAILQHTLEDQHLVLTADAEELRETIDLLLELELASTIHQIYEARCAAGVTDFNAELERLQVQYKKITGRRYPTPPCERRP